MEIINAFLKASARGLLIFLFLGNLLLAQDKVYLYNGSEYEFDLRTSDIKKGLFKVPKTVDGNQVWYIYTHYDIEKIITKDSALVKVIFKNDDVLGRLFAYINSEQKTVFYVDQWENIKELKVQKKDSIKASKRKVYVDEHSFKDTIRYAGSHLNFKFGLRLTNTMSTYTFNDQERILSSSGNFSTIATEKKQYLTFFSPSIGFSYLNKRKNLHDFELGLIKKTYNFIQTERSTATNTFTTSGSEISNVGFALSYRFSYFFFKKSNSKFLPSLGLGVAPSFNFSSNKPLLSNSFLAKSFTLTIPFYVEPTLNYFVSQKFFIFLSIPIQVNQLIYLYQSTDNPSLPLNNRSVDKFKGDTFFKTNTWYLRFGLVVKLK